MTPTAEIIFVAVLVSVSCALPGVFLVLRKMSMVSDSITHTILLGIVLAFFLTQDLNSPLLIVGATIIGVVTVWLIELLTKMKFVSEDSAIGIVFPLLFSIAIILITRYAGSVHLDTDAVLLGELAFAPFNRMILFGVDIGAKAIYLNGILLLINLLLISLFFKEFKLVTFDPMHAAVLGISPTIVHYILMTMVSLTTVGSFEAVGSILVVAFMIGPPITAYLLVDDLKKMLLLSGGFGALSAILGFYFSLYFDVSIAGSMAVMTGFIFLVVFVFAPKRGLISILIRKNQQKTEFSKDTMLLHICNHMNDSDMHEENGIATIYEHLGWDKKKTNQMMQHLIEEQKVQIKSDVLIPTEYGQEARDVIIKKIFG